LPVPNHRASCQTWLYPTKCWDCGAPIHVLQCTCGSAVLFDEPHPPWDEHDCSETGTIGRSGLKGWIAADVLRANGVSISPKIMAMLFPESSAKKNAEPPPQPIKKMGPKSGQSLDLLAVVREISRSTKRTAELDVLSGVGAKLLNLGQALADHTRC
jgi:hypothetical protein